MRATRLIAGKELRVQARRRSLFVLGFGAPLLLAFVMNLVFGGIDDPDAPVTFDIALASLDDGGAAAGFEELVGSIAESGLLDLDVVDSEDAAREAVDSGDANAAWVVPPGFSDAVASVDDAATILVIADVDAPSTASVARSIADSYATRLGTGRMAGLVALETGVVDVAGTADVARTVAEQPPLLTVTPSESGATVLDTGTTLMAGMALFFAFFTAGLPLLGLIEERDNATLHRLLVAPIHEGAIVAGKTLASILLGIVSLLALMVASSFLMGIEWGPLAGAIPLGIAAIVAVAGIMSIAGSTARTAEAAGTVQSIVAVVLAMLGGAFVPIPPTGGLLGLLQALTPHGWYFAGLESIHGGDASAALGATAVLLTMGTVTLAIGSTLSRRALRR